MNTTTIPCSCFSRAVVEVTLSSLEGENTQVVTTFESLLFKATSSASVVMVTDTMKELYDVVKDGTDQFIYLRGPPGVGKTTSLYWLYKQLQH